MVYGRMNQVANIIKFLLHTMDKIQKLTDWLQTIICGLVSDSEMVNIVTTNDEQGVLFTVSVSKEDTGKIIGRQGSIAEAIRVLLRSAGMGNQVRASMKIIDQEK